MDDSITHKQNPWMMLFIRIVLFILFQSLFAIGLGISGKAMPWAAGANWWPVSVTITNLVCVYLMARFFRSEGKQFWDIFRIRRDNLKSDLLAILGITIVIGPIGFFPNIWLGSLLFSDPQVSLEMLIRPLPMWAVLFSLVAFPLTQGLAELPTYFSYVMPRLEEQGMRSRLAVSLPALMLGFQHCAVPLLFDLPFFTWRLLMYVPFAFAVGIVLHWRPRLLPYLAVIHVLMDASFAVMLLNSAF